MTLINSNGNGGNGKTRLHIQKQMPDGVSINVFGDYPDEVVALLISTIELCDGTREIKSVTPTQKEAPLESSFSAKAGNPVGQGSPRIPATEKKSYAQLDPVCPSCQSSENVKFIQGTNKGTGKPFARHKCEACNKWI